MSRDLLLEIGIEELPSRFLNPALEELAGSASALLEEYRLDFAGINTFGTPRRLVLLVEGLAEEQASLELEVKGPPAKAAFDISGQPTKAAEGFARGQGVDVSGLIVRPVGKVDYVFAVRREDGLPAHQILAQLCPRLISGLSFPKPMRWGDYDMKFARPIRWLVSLFGPDVVPFTLAGVDAGRLTYGHRILSPGPHRLDDAVDYLNLMREAYVVVDSRERRKDVWEQIQRVAAEAGGKVREHESLLDEVNNLLEYPTAFVGSFPESYLRLPEPVLVTPMREHQRYFPVYGPDGKLLNKFVGVHNGTPDHLDNIRAGNEKVLRARLADAEFFFNEDLETPLAQKVDGLKKIVYQEELGSVYDKVERLGSLTAYLGDLFALSPGERETALRGAFLSKADLVTSMVYEFPELQGIMGREYALRSGENPEVAEAVYEHYLPRYAGDDLPSTTAGTVLSLAERLDNLVGSFGRGIQPSGSQDPYGLRRQALGLCHILLEQERALSLAAAFTRAHELFGERLKVPIAEMNEALADFVRQRLRGILAERGMAYDVMDAVLAVPFDDVVDTRRRAEALASLREEEKFGDIYTVLTRAGNLAKHADDSEVDPVLFIDPAETDLFKAYARTREIVLPLFAQGRYLDGLRALASLKAPVDGFFDAVMVMVEDKDVRRNRLALLSAIAGLVRPVADFAKLVVS